MDEKEAKRWDDRIKERRLWEAIGKRIREARQNKELTVEELSGLVDLVPQTLYRIEVGVSGTTITKLQRFCDVLDLDIAELLGMADNESTQLRLAARGWHLTPEQLQKLIEYGEGLTKGNW